MVRNVEASNLRMYGQFSGLGKESSVEEMEVVANTGDAISTLRFTEYAPVTPLLRVGGRACAGIIATFATYPSDMMRRRLTVQSLQA